MESIPTQYNQVTPEACWAWKKRSLGICPACGCEGIYLESSYLTVHFECGDMACFTKYEELDQDGNPLTTHTNWAEDLLGR